MSDRLERPQHVRIRCEHTKRLIATVEASGLRLWCKYEKTSELISWDMIDAARKEAVEHKESQQEVCGEAS